jgi:hypothetical protein
MIKDVRSTENDVRKKLYGGATLDNESYYTDMKRLLIIAAIAVAALTMVSWGVAHRHPNLTESPDRNVPGATTGQGRSSLN